LFGRNFKIAITQSAFEAAQAFTEKSQSALGRNVAKLIINSFL